MLNDTELADLVDYYEPEDPAGAAVRWRGLFDPAATGPVSLVNRFTLRTRAAYADGHEAAGSDTSGLEAFMTYAATSVPAVDRVGGRFLLSSPVVTSMFGARDDTDLVVVGWFPDRRALLAMLRDPGYRAAYAHRRAAVASQWVVAANAP